MVRMSEEELANAMPYEAEQHIPFDVYDVNTDFQILSATDANPSRMGRWRCCWPPPRRVARMS